jgi:hypothetical protein
MKCYIHRKLKKVWGKIDMYWNQNDQIWQYGLTLDCLFGSKELALTETVKHDLTTDERQVVTIHEHGT